MTLPTGVKGKQRGFTLIEVMVTVAILSLATVTISQSNLMNLNVYGRFTSRLAIQNWADQKIWEAKEGILASDLPQTGEYSGVYDSGNRRYEWHLSVTDGTVEDLYVLSLNVDWNESGRTAHLERLSYVSRLESSK